MKKILSVMISAVMIFCLFAVGASAVDPDDTEEVDDAELLLGDVNEDHDIDSLDAAIVLRFDAGIIELSGDQIIAADYNKDGVVDSIDATLILKYDVGI